QRYPPWDEAARQGHALLDDAAHQGGSPVERYRLYQEAVAWLREHHRLHPLEAPAVLARLEGHEAPVPDRLHAPRPMQFGGFWADPFRFLEELAQNNNRAWMEGQRDRYRFAVREPLVELCRVLAERYVEPVLCRQHGWDLETGARPGKALGSVCKN